MGSFLILICLAASKPMHLDFCDLSLMKSFSDYFNWIASYANKIYKLTCTPWILRKKLVSPQAINYPKEANRLLALR